MLFFPKFNDDFKLYFDKLNLSTNFNLIINTCSINFSGRLGENNFAAVNLALNLGAGAGKN